MARTDESIADARGCNCGTPAAGLTVVWFAVNVGNDHHVMTMKRWRLVKPRSVQARHRPLLATVRATPSDTCNVSRTDALAALRARRSLLCQAC